MQSEPSCRVIDMRRNVVRIREIGCRCTVAEIDVAVAPLVEQQRGMRLDAAMQGAGFPARLSDDIQADIAFGKFIADPLPLAVRSECLFSQTIPQQPTKHCLAAAVPNNTHRHCIHVRLGRVGRPDDIESGPKRNLAEDLARLTPLQTSLKRNGGIWIVYPKGQSDITESDVLKAGRQAGLVDTKIARFSDTHTAHKFVIPLARR